MTVQEKFSVIKVPQKVGKIEDVLSRLRDSYETNLGESYTDEMWQSQTEYFTSPEFTKQKRRFLSPLIKSLQEIGNEHRITFPGVKDLADRVYYLDRITYKNIIAVERKESGNDSLGIVLPNRLCLINFDDCEENDDSDSALFATSVHELWHSLSYQETWQPLDTSTPYSGERFVRRSGFIDKRPGKMFGANLGLHFLMEAYTEFLTEQVLKRNNIEMSNPFNDHHLLIVKLLMEKHDQLDDIFFKGAFTKNGFRPFIKAMARISPVSPKELLKILIPNSYQETTNV